MAAPTSTKPPSPLRWWREALYVLGFYAVYTLIRNEGVAADSAKDAFEHAKTIIELERSVGLYFEEQVQEAFLSWGWFIQVWNVFYGSAHFVVTAGALIWCFRAMPARYPRWRNTLAGTTAVALVGFAFFPLMPPRLLPPGYGFVDTLARFGGLWSFDSGAMKSISNQYAAMPSLHFAWAAWSSIVLWPLGAGRRWAKALLLTYPVATLFAIVVTGNHFWLDAAGGALALGFGGLVAAALDLRRQRSAEDDARADDRVGERAAAAEPA